MNRFFYCILVSCVFLSVQVEAQLIKRGHAKLSNLPPKAILVELSMQTGRINFYKKYNDVANISLLQTDAAMQRSKMISDFKDHFTFCPVYYFYDTDQEKVKAKDFSVLMDSKMQPAGNLVINPSDSDYFIVYYGYEQEVADGKNGKVNASNGGESYTLTKNLVALNDNFEPLPHYLPYKPRHTGRLRSKKAYSQLANYFFESKKFDISYQPYAILYSRNLSIYYRQKL